MSMKVIYARQDLPAATEKDSRSNNMIIPNSLFLVGPTPRDKETKSWRPEALDILRDYGYDGTVFVPEDDNWDEKVHYNDQVHWEIQALGRSAQIVAWIDRELKHMPAFTTNTEFGFLYALKPHRLIVGIPDHAAKVFYQQWLVRNFKVFCEEFGLEKPDYLMPLHDNLSQCLDHAVQRSRMLGNY